MKKTTATFDMLPDDVRVYIASFLDTKSLCFFARTSRRSLGNALNELKGHCNRLLQQLHMHTGRGYFIYHTPHTLYACGYNAFGQVGLGHSIKNCNSLTQVEDWSGTIRQVATGYSHTLVLTDQGLYACGYNAYGQLGLGHNNQCSKLTKVENLPGTIRQVVAGGSHILVLTDQGLYTCGNNESGQLGLGHNNQCNRLTKVENLPGTVLQVVAGILYTLVLTNHGLYACGSNGSGQLGLRHQKYYSSEFIRIEHVPGVIQQVVAGGYHTFMLTDQGLYACGSNEFGQLGLGHNNQCKRLTKVENLPGTILQVVAGSEHSFVLTDQGLYACGNNDSGQLGLEDNTNRGFFTQIDSLPSEIKRLLSLYRHIARLIEIAEPSSCYQERSTHAPSL